MFDFNPYSPYNSYMAAQQRFGGQPMNQPSMMQNAPQQAQNIGITVAQVPTIEHVEQVQMAPGERKLVLVQNNPNFLAIRVADQAGFVSTEYRVTQVVDPKTLKTVPQYASVESVEALKNEIQQLKNIIGGVLNESNAKPSVRTEQPGNE